MYILFCVLCFALLFFSLCHQRIILCSQFSHCMLSHKLFQIIASSFRLIPDSNSRFYVFIYSFRCIYLFIIVFLLSSLTNSLLCIQDLLEHDIGNGVKKEKKIYIYIYFFFFFFFLSTVNNNNNNNMLCTRS